MKNKTVVSKKTVAELYEMLNQLKKETFNLRMQRSLGEAVNSSRFRTCRRDVARVKTHLRTLQPAQGGK